MSTKIVMQYKRTKPAWICWNCEMENDLADNNCYFCRAERANARILRPWVEERVRTEPVPPARPFAERKYAAESSASRSGGMTTGSYSGPSESGSSGNWVPIVIWGVVLTIFILIIIAASN
ncbi:MAG: hypothetical protein IKJ55_07295 [Clostridia bacterium]|nr:hypothetical protein [Clostridia bacterium]